MTSDGVLVADLIWAVAAVVGLTAALVSSQGTLDVVRYVGAGYRLTPVSASSSPGD